MPEERSPAEVRAEASSEIPSAPSPQFRVPEGRFHEEGISMNGPTHKSVTSKAFTLVRRTKGSFPLLASRIEVAKASRDTDDLEDLEFVNVRGGIGSGGRDDPHKEQLFAIDDHPSKHFLGNSLTAFNHFIDIKKGPGLFDDYDGYSYARGSAHSGEYQTASDYLLHDVTGSKSSLAKIVGGVLGALRKTAKVDKAINYWFNDEYVHARGQKWYIDCSPSVVRYSRPADKGTYQSVDEELAERFPLAKSSGSTNMGIPYSVFMPVDNLARHWYNHYVTTRDTRRVPVSLGRVMHAIQDASIPHHAAGCCGNWHTRYENDLEDLAEKALTLQVSSEHAWRDYHTTLSEWDRIDPDPPSQLVPADWSKTPAKNWRIDMLVTWVALNAYKAYSEIYHGFKGGYAFNPSSATHLVRIAAAMSAHVLAMAEGLEIGSAAHGREPARPSAPRRARPTSVAGRTRTVRDHRTR